MRSRNHCHRENQLSITYSECVMRSRNHCYSEKQLSITYSKYVFVALVIQHA